MSIGVTKSRYISDSKCTVTIEMHEPYDFITKVFLPGDILSDSQFEFLLRYWGFIKGDNPMNTVKDAKVTIEKVEDKGQYKARVTIEILNPIPKTAKFFRCIDEIHPEHITLKGRLNKVSGTFLTEKEGRQWANDILLAVMRKSREEMNRGAFISPSEIDIEFHPSSDNYTPSLLQEEKPDTSHCFGNYNVNAEVCLYCNRGERCLIDRGKSDPKDNYPECIGNYPLSGGKCVSCPEPYFNICQGVTDKKKEQDVKPDCFGRFEDCLYCSHTNECRLESTNV